MSGVQSNIVKLEDKAILSDLLASRHFLLGHSCQDTVHLFALLVQKPIWTCGPECCGWHLHGFATEVLTVYRVRTYAKIKSRPGFDQKIRVDGDIAVG
jgi:hypothetical protein